MKRRGSQRSVLGIAAFALVAAALVALMINFAPTRLGGRMSYVTINGNSMEPGLHKGDLVITERHASYEVGDVVVYRHPDIGPVIHRIIAREGSSYVFKGDNNDFIDGEQPEAGALMGEQRYLLPGMGTWLMRLQDPALLAALTVSAIIGLAVWELGQPAVRRKRRTAPSRISPGVSQ